MGDAERANGSAAMPADDGRTVPSEQTNKDRRSTSTGWPSWPPSDQPKLLDVDMQGWSLYAVSDDEEDLEHESDCKTRLQN